MGKTKNSAPLKAYFGIVSEELTKYSMWYKNQQSLKFNFVPLNTNIPFLEIEIEKNKDEVI